MVKVVKLKSGLRLALEYIPHVQSAAMGIWVNVGSRNETAEVSGVSHFIEHMMFKGTENRTYKEIAEDIDKLGGQINAFTGKETTCYYIKTISPNLLAGADVLVDMLTNSLFLDEEMDKERKVVKEEIKMTLDTPDDLAIDKMVELVFSKDSYGNSILGTDESLDGIHHDEMKAYFNREYTLDRMLVSISGNFDEDEIVTYFEDKFTFFKKEHDTPNFRKDGYEKADYTIHKDIEQSHIAIGNRAIKIADDRYYDLVLLNKIFGGSMSSRLFQNLREKKGLAYTVVSMASFMQQDGYFAIYAGVAHDRVSEALEGIKEELDKLLKDGVTEEELAMAKEQVKSSYIFGQESVASRMFTNGKNILLTGNVDTEEDVIRKVDKVTTASVQKLIDEICHFEDYTKVVVTGNEN
ncbi:MAG: insulinase family protein [Clostridia bacterium]|nr:insulinase family protein [Clostridia bacterium]